MPTGIEETVGLALAGVSLLEGFAAAVDGYNLIRDMFATDNGLRSLAADWHVEMVRFKRWGEHFRVDAGSKSLLHTESALIRGAIGSVIADILALQQQTQPMLERYGIRDLQAPVPRGPSDGTFQEGGKWVETLRKRRRDITQVHAVSWTMRDKDRLQDIVFTLGRRNDQLWSLVRASEADAVRQCTAMLESIKARQDSEPEVSLLGVQQQISAHPNSLLALSFRLRELQSSDFTSMARQVVRLTAKEITILGSENAASGLTLGSYFPAGGMPRDVFVEWKAVDASNPARDKIVERIHALGALLSESNAVEFRRPTHIGTFDDQGFADRKRGSRRIALVYTLPPSAEGRLPVSLASLLSAAATTKHRPPLGQRFLLACRLAAAVSLFHATNWLHKAIRPDNILFASADRITDPLIVGFQYSRPAGDSSLEMRPPANPETELYYHPDAAAGWTRLMDIYGLGVVLWEIANWRPAFEERYRAMNAKEVSFCLIEELEGEPSRVWDGLVGEVYMDVVRRCLRGDFGVRNGTDEQEARVLGTKFFLKVVKELESCKA